MNITSTVNVIDHKIVVLLVQRTIPGFGTVRCARMGYFTHVPHGQSHLLLEFQLIDSFIVRQVQKRLTVYLQNLIADLTQVYTMLCFESRQSVHFTLPLARNDQLQNLCRYRWWKYQDCTLFLPWSSNRDSGRLRSPIPPGKITRALSKTRDEFHSS